MKKIKPDFSTNILSRFSLCKTKKILRRLNDVDGWRFFLQLPHFIKFYTLHVLYVVVNDSMMRMYLTKSGLFCHIKRGFSMSG